MTLDRTNAAFQTTQWALLNRLKDPNSGERAAALDAIVQTYWPAVYASVRRSGRTRDQAAELTQAFFADVVLGRGLLGDADQARGRLRTLMLTALKRYTVDQHRREAADPTRGLALGDLDQEEAMIAAAPDSDPDAAFDRRWALAILNLALERCEHHFRRTRKERHWEAFAARIVGPALGNCPAAPLARIGSELGFATPADAAAAVQTVRKRVLAILREVVGETASDPAEAEAEYKLVLSLLS